MSVTSRDARTRRLFALAVAGAVHIGIVNLMALSLPDRQERPSEPPVELRAVGVYLSAGRENHRVQAAPRRREMTPKPDVWARPTISPTAKTSPASAAATPPASISGAPLPAIGNSVQGAAKSDDDRLRAALRSSAGCGYELTSLTEAEREHCQLRLDRAAREARALPVGPSDPKKRALLDHEIRVDDAFRSYRASNRMDDYPGLATFVPMPPSLKQLFRNGEPRQPSNDTPPPQ